MTTATSQPFERLQRLYAAVGQVIDKEDVRRVKPQVTLGANGTLSSFFVHFGGEMPKADLESRAWNAIHQLATFASHCHAWAQQNGVAKEEVTAVTENCLALQIVRDLDTSDKHPAVRANLSGLSPRLANVARVLRITSRPAETPKSAVVGGVVVRGGEPSLTIIGDIVNDRNGQRVHGFPEVVEEGIAAWESFLRSKGAPILAG